MEALQKPCGLVELYRPANGTPDIDIIAVHGLNGDARRTWTNPETRACWLSHGDFLPLHIKSARVLSWGYNSSFSSISGALPSNNLIHHHAQTLVAQLAADRIVSKHESTNSLIHINQMQLESQNDSPIIFLCHSLGGLVVKRALSYSKSREDNETTYSIFKNTFGMLFFGTPHRGSSHADLLLTLQKLATLALPRSFIQNEQVLVNALKYESETLQNITDFFDPLIKYFHIHFFWEEEKTDLRYKKEYIVTKDSAAPEYDNTERSGIAATHSNMVKFGTTSSPGFRIVMATLCRYYDLAVANRRRASSTSSLPPYSREQYTMATTSTSNVDTQRVDTPQHHSAAASLYMPALPAAIEPLVIDGCKYTFGRGAPTPRATTQGDHQAAHNSLR
ncbi:uncharacterized protein B0I36DRAFT_4629 [Microdochium trichocladiopsis]|uniref:DUF676 domain-containing protein n=1 Tax=Microdochium trichocladiopsis TaxID=1682393 RepID=A0A9P8YGU1_9PEZI|nr:uncharacterized protein B0I36DRAFT_4629 [Microdochium trichocladiopsis]KAH7040025.1 hypothetical protein B0I36DRAFT_4629 [Microdochium trichocladiopsis]